MSITLGMLMISIIHMISLEEILLSIFMSTIYVCG
jgi:hypothetical protein